MSFAVIAPSGEPSTRRRCSGEWITISWLAQIARTTGRGAAYAPGLVVSEGPAPTRSELERRFLALCRDAGLPPPAVNVVVAGFEVDAVWPDRRLVVELDGHAFHGTRAAFERDRVRDASLQLAGYRVLRVPIAASRGSPSRSCRPCGPSWNTRSPRERPLDHRRRRAGRGAGHSPAPGDSGRAQGDASRRGRPVVQYVVEELADAGIGRMLLVTPAARPRSRTTSTPEAPSAGVRVASSASPSRAGWATPCCAASGFAGDRPFAVALGDAIVPPPRHGRRRIVAALEDARAAQGSVAAVEVQPARRRARPLRTSRPRSSPPPTGAARRPSWSRSRRRAGAERLRDRRPLRVPPAMFDTLRATPPGAAARSSSPTRSRRSSRRGAAVLGVRWRRAALRRRDAGGVLRRLRGAR